MSHEIRTPLNGIVAGADILAKADLTPRARELVDIILMSGRSLERLLTDILDLVRVEAGHVAIQEGPFHIGDLARSVAALSGLGAEDKGLPVRVNVTPDADAAATGDGARLRQVLTNLLSNAVKFTDQGHVTLDVARSRTGAVRFCVSDTGVGFDVADKAQIFDRFQQVDTSFTRRFGGAGLGLAISRELVELMGGDLCCDSVQGAGSSFWFELPLPLHHEAEADPRTEEPAGRAMGDLRVLVADDHPTNRKIVELMLAGQARIVLAENGLDAVEAARHAPFDLVLMDMQMPVMDGLTAVRQIRALESQAGRGRTPIIMLTANARPEHVQASREAGADLHLEKPITAASLFTAIGQVFDCVEPPAVACRAS
jgi:CheY-like chemotaxis protein